MININMISREEFDKYELSFADIPAVIKYGRSVKAFKTNRLRAQATRAVEKKLGMTQKEFAKVDKETRLDLVHAQTRVLVNQLKLRWKIKMFNK